MIHGLDLHSLPKHQKIQEGKNRFKPHQGGYTQGGLNLACTSKENMDIVQEQLL